jgi:membrane protein implicated in regulation of membrane protease activity
MDSWIIWLIAGVFAAVGELATGGLYLAPFALGAFAGMLAGLVGGGSVVQLVLFAALTLGSFSLLRPIAKRHMYTPPQLRTGTAALVGKPAIVVERIANDENEGSVRIDGEVWTARCLDDDHVIEPGTKVQVVEIRGATAVVIP